MERSWTRREALRLGAAVVGSALLAASPAGSAAAATAAAAAAAAAGRTRTARAARGRSDTSARTPRHRLAVLHIAPGAGALDANRALLGDGLDAAAAGGATMLLTPELAVSGYGFRAVLGLGWVPVLPDRWTRRFGQRAHRFGVTPVLGTPERDRRTGRLHNSLVVLDSDGDVLGRHRKVHVIPAPVEDWATPGTDCRPVTVDGIPTGLLVCADSYTAPLAAQARRRGAALLLSGAAWTPGPMGPAGCWESRSRETGLSFVVANRTGREPGSDFRACTSVGDALGRRVFTRASPESQVILVDLVGRRLVPHVHDVVRLG